MSDSISTKYYLAMSVKPPSSFLSCHDNQCFLWPKYTVQGLPRASSHHTLVRPNTIGAPFNSCRPTAPQKTPQSMPTERGWWPAGVRGVQVPLSLMAVWLWVQPSKQISDQEQGGRESRYRRKDKTSL